MQKVKEKRKENLENFAGYWEKSLGTKGDEK